MNESIRAEDDPEIQAQLVLLAATNQDLTALRSLLRNVPASVQDPETGFTPLHAAILACEDNHFVDETLSNERTDSALGAATNGSAERATDAAAKTLKLLLQNGAIWNDVDKNDETPGCVAMRLGLKDLYEIMVDAGVRAEMLLNRLDEYEALPDDEDGDGEEQNQLEKTEDASDKDSDEGAATGASHINTRTGNEPCNEDYLQASLRFQDGRILDEAGNAVMMAWETPIMKRTADLLCPTPSLRVLNVGHGMGIIDFCFQYKAPVAHHIIEAHPTVLERMKKYGWLDMPSVTVHEGRWQDVIPKIMEQGEMFDAIYFDTFAEDYNALRDFFSDCVVGLLDDGGRWGFFNGMGADRQICYDVYTKLVEIDLFEAGFDTLWETISVEEMKEGEWEGVKRRYWTLPEYKLPICTFSG